MKRTHPPGSNKAKYATHAPSIQGDGWHGNYKRPTLGMVRALGTYATKLEGADPLGHVLGHSGIHRALEGGEHSERQVPEDEERTNWLDHEKALGVEDSDVKASGSSSATAPEKPKQGQTWVRPRAKAKDDGFDVKNDMLSRPTVRLKAHPSREASKRTMGSDKPHPVGSGDQSSSSTEIKHAPAGKKRKRSAEGPFQLPVKKCIIKKAGKFSILDRSLYVTFEKNSLKFARDGRNTVFDIDIRAYDERLLARYNGGAQDGVLLRIDWSNNRGGKRPAYEEVSLLLDCKHSDWDPEIFQELCLWYQPHACPPAPAAQDLWEKVEAEAEGSLGRHPESCTSNTATTVKHEG